MATNRFYARKQLLLSARLSHPILSVCLSVCPSVRLSHGWISKLPNFHRRLPGRLVSGTIKLFHKFEGGYLKRGHQMRGGWAKFAISGQ